MISPLAYVDPAAQIGQNVEIGPFVYIEGDVRIGDDCVIMPHVSILMGPPSERAMSFIRTRSSALNRNPSTSRRASNPMW